MSWKFSASLVSYNKVFNDISKCNTNNDTVKYLNTLMCIYLKLVAL
jgi:hypothetical protein